MRPLTHLSIVAIFALQAAIAATVEPTVAELNFDTKMEEPGALAEAHAPEWITKVGQTGGKFFDNPRCWHVPATEPKGAGRISIGLDRHKLNEDLVATILFDAEDDADVAVQLFDAQGRVVDVDLFGNLVDIGKEATTDTFIVPLRKYPTAESIVLRRITGDVKIYGVVLYPVVTSGEPNAEALKKLAAVLADPLSPENPLVKGIQQVAKQSNVAIDPVKSATVTPVPKPVIPPPKATPPPRGKFSGAVAPTAGAKIPPAATAGLVGYWNFDKGDASDASGLHHDGRIRGGVQIVAGLRGKALLLRKNPSTARAAPWDSVTVAPTPDLDLKDTLTVSAWIKYKSIARQWGSQVVWFGDTQFGRDPWNLHLLKDGRIELRSDRSVTGKPLFVLVKDEIKLSPKGEPLPNQHVAATSEKTLAPDTWYFVAGTIEKLSPRRRALKVFVNGDLVGEATTEETVNYDTAKMWMTIGGVDEGTWQNFDGLIDEVRVYNRALSLAELRALYNQPWQ